jgi:hypothetical protein
MSHIGEGMHTRETGDRTRAITTAAAISLSSFWLSRKAIASMFRNSDPEVKACHCFSTGEKYPSGPVASCVRTGLGHNEANGFRLLVRYARINGPLASRKQSGLNDEKRPADQLDLRAGFAGGWDVCVRARDSELPSGNHRRGSWDDGLLDIESDECRPIGCEPKARRADGRRRFASSL